MKYGAEIIKQVGINLAAGMSRQDTWEIVGITESTFYEWMKRPEFSEAVKKGEFACKQRNIVRIQNASKKSWVAAAWWLERKFPEEFAQRVKQETTVRGGLAVRMSKKLDLSRLSDGDLKALAKRVAPGDAGK